MLIVVISSSRLFPHSLSSPYEDHFGKCFFLLVLTEFKYLTVGFSGYFIEFPATLKSSTRKMTLES